MRRVTHPGPVAAERLEIVPCRAEPLAVTLAAGVPLEQAVARAMADAGFGTGWLEVDAAPVARLRYVMPDHASDGRHVAWYSAAQGFDAGTIRGLGMVVGRHGAASFLHGHGIWAPQGGAGAMGHILAPETVLARPARATGFGIRGAAFRRGPDPETAFDLFHPHPDGAAPGDPNAALLRIRPNEDLTEALDRARARLGWDAARVHGVGSINRPVFTDGRMLDSLPTEFLIRGARVGPGMRQGPHMAIVGVEGAGRLEGALERGANAVLITAELILIRD